MRGGRGGGGGKPPRTSHYPARTVARYDRKEMQPAMAAVIFFVVFNIALYLGHKTYTHRAKGAFCGIRNHPPTIHPKRRASLTQHPQPTHSPRTCPHSPGSRKPPLQE
jgi:hypothetical protein